MNGRSLLLFLILLAAAGGTLYVARSLNVDVTGEEASPNLQDGFYLRAVRVLGTGDDGRRIYEVEAEYAEQRGEDMIEFQNVRVIYTPDAGVPWTLDADSAFVWGSQERLVLEGHVIAVGTEGLNGEVTEIRTPYLELWPREYRAETDDRVQVRIGSRSLTATGMLASLKNNRFSLKSNVSGKFVP